MNEESRNWSDDDDDDDTWDDDNELVPPEDVVELHHGYWFDCPECGTENLVRAVTRFMDPGRPEDLAQLRADFDSESVDNMIQMHEESNTFRVKQLSFPRTIACRRCHDRFIGMTAGDWERMQNESEED